MELFADSFMREYFYQINGLVSLVLLFINAWLVINLISAMREMFSRKYHVDPQAEIDEKHVKSVLFLYIFVIIFYIGIWVYSVITDDILISNEHYSLTKTLFAIALTSMGLITFALAYATFRIRIDVKDIDGILQDDNKKEQPKSLLHRF